MADEGPLVQVLWIDAGLSRDGDSVALTAAMQPTIEDIALGSLPGLPRVAVHWPLHFCSRRKRSSGRTADQTLWPIRAGDQSNNSHSSSRQEE